MATRGIHGCARGRMHSWRVSGELQPPGASPKPPKTPQRSQGGQDSPQTEQKCSCSAQLSRPSCSTEHATAQHGASASSPTAPAGHLLLIHPCNKVSLASEKSPKSLIKDYLGPYGDRAGRNAEKAIQEEQERWQKEHRSSWHEPPRWGRHGQRRGVSVR